jgi:hypothetical protein
MGHIHRGATRPRSTNDVDHGFVRLKKNTLSGNVLTPWTWAPDWFKKSL